MAMATSRGRRRLSKRQKRRSLKRKNVKSRKVMRGGAYGDDPLLGVKEDDTVTVTITSLHQQNPFILDYKPPPDIEFVCKVIKVQDSNSKIVTLELSKSEDFRFETLFIERDARTSEGKYKKKVFEEYDLTFDIKFEGGSYNFQTYIQKLKGHNHIASEHSSVVLVSKNTVRNEKSYIIKSVSIKPMSPTE